MALFIAIIICNLRIILFRALLPWVVRICSTSSSKDTRAGILLLAFLLSNSLSELLSSLFRDFHIARGIICRLGILDLWLKLLNSMVLHGKAPSLYLGHSDMSEMIVLLSLVVYILNVGSRLEAYFGLSLDRFLDHLFLGVYFSTSLLHLSLYQRFKIFSKESNEIGFFWSPVSVKP